MDYEVFLVSGMREAYVHGASARDAVVKGFVSSAKVVTAAAVIMIAVFGAFVPTGDPIIKSIALGLAVGVFTDAFLVRMTLVPAVLALLGDRAWSLPGWLDRLLPRVDVEGEGLVHQVALRDWPHADGTPIFEGIDVAVSRGDVLAVSGHGSSALLLTLSGRIAPDRGELKIAGMVVPEENRKIRRTVPFLTLDSPDAGLMVDAAAMRQIAKNPPDLLVIDHADRAHDTQTADAVAHLVAAAIEHGSAVILGLVDQRVDWMMPPHTRYSLLDLEADRLAPLASGGAHS
jgi:RND superfamily putative drug exporter